MYTGQAVDLNGHIGTLVSRTCLRAGLRACGISQAAQMPAALSGTSRYTTWRCSVETGGRGHAAHLTDRWQVEESGKHQGQMERGQANSGPEVLLLCRTAPGWHKCMDSWLRLGPDRSTYGVIFLPICTSSQTFPQWTRGTSNHCTIGKPPGDESSVLLLNTVIEHSET